MSPVAGLVAAAALAVQLGVSSRPDFSGQWTLVQDRSSQTPSGQAMSVAGLLGERFTAKQDQARLTLTISAVGLVIDARYALDGSETRNVNPGGPGRPDEFIYSTCSWHGERLVIVTRNPIPGSGSPFESRRELWIDADGLLTIEREVAGSPTLRSVYRRTP